MPFDVPHGPLHAPFFVAFGDVAGHYLEAVVTGEIQTVAKIPAAR
jgi:hypothetical protein